MYRSRQFRFISRLESDAVEEWVYTGWTVVVTEFSARDNDFTRKGKVETITVETLERTTKAIPVSIKS